MGKKKKEKVTFERPTFDNPFASLAGDLPAGEQEPAVAEITDEVDYSSVEKVRLQKERKNRGGKTVTVVSGLHGLTEPQRKQLLSVLKTKLGTGAFLEETNIVLQGDVGDRASAILGALGFKDVK